MSFQKVLDKYRNNSYSQRDKGDRFERLMQAYLKTDPKYASKFKKVWLWGQFPGKLQLGGGDTGIDLVALKAALPTIPTIGQKKKETHVIFWIYC